MIVKSFLELDNAFFLEFLKILEEWFKNIFFVLLDVDNKVKFFNIGVFVAFFKNDVIKIFYFMFKK